MEKSNFNFYSIDEIPLSYRSIFETYPCFNSVQSKVFKDVFGSDCSLVVSAPTGSGKTVIFELALVRLLTLYHPSNIKAIYVCPIKALCRERFMDWQQKFSNFSIQCILLTGDNDFGSNTLSYYNLIITTPEKWDVLTRKWTNNNTLITDISLFMIDEIHLLNTDSRGSTLEVIITRMKTIHSVLANRGKINFRILALSATIPNIDDIANWIGPNGTAKYYKFSEEVRPVKLNKIVFGYPLHSNDKSIFKFDLSLNYKLQDLITKYSNGQPTLIFCNTRKSVEITAKHLVNHLQIRLNSEQTKLLNGICDKYDDNKLKQYMIHGIAYHHAGLNFENRQSVEEAFRKGHIPVLVTTSTLAMGVNLPAHLVIIKSTKCYMNGGYRDYDDISIFQMIGRAGRCQFDTTATAIIMTSEKDQQKYEKMVSCTQLIESNLHKHLPEHLNAEIALKTITDLEIAMRWLSATFLYVRATKCPEKYKLPVGLSREKLDKKLLEMCQIQINKLSKLGMIRINQAIELSSTILGEIMAKYYVALDTMALFTEVSGDEHLMQLLAVFSKCHEFSDIFLRHADKKCLNFLNNNKTKETIRFPLAGRIKTVDMKVNCLIQAVIGNLEISNQSLLNDAVRILRHCERLSKCLIEFLETKSSCFIALKNAIRLAKCFRAKLWENSSFVSKQLTGVGQILSRLLAKSEKTSFKSIAETNPRIIEMLVGRKPPFGNVIVEEAKHIPQYNVTVEKLNNSILLKILLLNLNVVKKKITVDLQSTMTLLVGDSCNNLLLYEQYTHSYLIENSKIEKCIRLETNNVEYIVAEFISNDWVGFDCHFQLPITENVSEKLNRSNGTVKQTFMEMYMTLGKFKKKNNKKLPAATTTPRSDETGEVENICQFYAGGDNELSNMHKTERIKNQTENVYKSTASTIRTNSISKDTDKYLELNTISSINDKMSRDKRVSSNELKKKRTFKFKTSKNDTNHLSMKTIPDTCNNKTSTVLLKQNSVKNPKHDSINSLPIENGTTINNNNNILKLDNYNENINDSILSTEKLNKKLFKFKPLLENNSFESQNNMDHNCNYIINEILSPKLNQNVANIKRNIEVISKAVEPAKSEEMNVTKSTRSGDPKCFLRRENDSDDIMFTDNGMFRNECAKYTSFLASEDESIQDIYKNNSNLQKKTETSDKSVMYESSSTQHPNKIKSLSVLPDFRTYSKQSRINLPEQKTIKWRSPLICSPPETYKVEQYYDINENKHITKGYSNQSYDLQGNDTNCSNVSLMSPHFTSSLNSNSSPSKRKQLKFAIRDQDYDWGTFNRKCRKIDDIIEMKYFGLPANNFLDYSQQTCNSLSQPSVANDYYNSLMRLSSPLIHLCDSDDVKKTSNAIQLPPGSSVSNYKLYMENLPQLSRSEKSYTEPRAAYAPDKNQISAETVYELPQFKERSTNGPCPAAYTINLPMRKTVECYNINQSIYGYISKLT